MYKFRSTTLKQTKVLIDMKESEGMAAQRGTEWFSKEPCRTNWYSNEPCGTKWFSKEPE